MPVTDTGLTLVSIVSCASSDPGSPVYSRAWRIHSRSADAFAQAMTEKYGAPVQEGLSTVRATREAAERSAEEGFLFTDGEEGPDA
jgi:hypothetical protein